VICRRNLVPVFVDRGMSRGQRGGSPTVVILSFLDRRRYFSFKQLWFYMGVKHGLLTVSEEHKLRVFENRVLRIFGPRGIE
jgi:hypothetical protein